MEDQILNVHGFKSIPRAMIRTVFTTMSGNVIYYVHYVKPNGERDSISQQFMGPTADADSLELFELEVLRDFTPEPNPVDRYRAALEEIRDYRGEHEDYIDVTVSLKGIAREALS